jgi:hypothetical protein
LAAANASRRLAKHPESARQRPRRWRSRNRRMPAVPQVNGAKARLPQTPETARHWVDCWMAMCRDGLANGPISNQMSAECRRRYGWTIKQLRYVRRAAHSGALRRQALLLGVDLPAGYCDRPSAVDGHPLAGLVP